MVLFGKITYHNFKVMVCGKIVGEKCGQGNDPKEGGGKQLFGW